MYDFSETSGKHQMTTYSDSDFAGNKETRKSTSGGMILMGGHFVKSWAKTQSTVALSSAEAELYGIAKATAEFLGIRSMCHDWNIERETTLFADASAAIGIIQRVGLGKLRHLDTSYLWLQQQHIKNNVPIKKIHGPENPADLGTKALKFESIEKHISKMNMRFESGRADIAPELNLMLRKKICQRNNTVEMSPTVRLRQR